MVTLYNAKQQTRKYLKAILGELSADAIVEKSYLIADRLFVSRWWNDADTVLAFCSMPREVDTSFILARAIEQVKTVGIPRVQGDELIFHRLRELDANFSIGMFDIREPAPDWPVLDIGTMRIGKLLIITPGLAFDRSLNRLGRGKGFYDRFLRMARTRDSENIRAVGVCFSEQLLENVPVGNYDLAVDGVITECETIY